MNTNLGNQYYNKYIKYKTKYLELKESEGGNYLTRLFYNDKNKYGKQSEKIKTLVSYLKNNKNNIDNIAKIEEYLLNELINELLLVYNYEDFIDLSKLIYKFILNYREYINIKKLKNNVFSYHEVLKLDILTIEHVIILKVKQINQMLKLHALKDIVKIYLKNVLENINLSEPKYIKIVNINVENNVINKKIYNKSREKFANAMKDIKKIDIKEKIKNINKITNIKYRDKINTEFINEFINKLNLIQYFIKINLFTSNKIINNEFELITSYIILIRILLNQYYQTKLSFNSIIEYDYNTRYYSRGEYQVYHSLDGGNNELEKTNIHFFSILSNIYHFIIDIEYFNALTRILEYNNKNYTLPKQTLELCEVIQKDIENKLPKDDLIEELKGYVQYITNVSYEINY